MASDIQIVPQLPMPSDFPDIDNEPESTDQTAAMRLMNQQIQLPSHAVSSEGQPSPSKSESQSLNNTEEYQDLANKKKVHRFTPEQLVVLINYYERNDRWPNREVRNKLATQFGVTPRKIQVWFQNKRARMKARGDKLVASNAAANVKMSFPYSNKMPFSMFMPHNRVPSSQNPLFNNVMPFNPLLMRSQQNPLGTSLTPSQLQTMLAFQQSQLNASSSSSSASSNASSQILGTHTPPSRVMASLNEFSSADGSHPSLLDLMQYFGSQMPTHLPPSQSQAPIAKPSLPTSFAQPSKS